MTLCLPDLLYPVLCILSPLMSIHDHNGHDEEANVGYED